MFVTKQEDVDLIFYTPDKLVPVPKFMPKPVGKDLPWLLIGVLKRMMMKINNDLLRGRTRSYPA